MKISELISILENSKEKNGDLNVSVLYNDFAYELDPIYIDVVEKDKGGFLLTISIEDYVDGIKNSKEGEENVS
jgi:hypothetical protein